MHLTEKQQQLHSSQTVCPLAHHYQREQLYTHGPTIFISAHSLLYCESVLYAPSVVFCFVINY